MKKNEKKGVRIKAFGWLRPVHFHFCNHQNINYIRTCVPLKLNTEHINRSPNGRISSVLITFYPCAQSNGKQTHIHMNTQASCGEIWRRMHVLWWIDWVVICWCCFFVFVCLLFSLLQCASESRAISLKCRYGACCPCSTKYITFNLA